MIDHFGINCSDMPTAARFYDGVLGVLGHRRVMDFGVAIGYGTEAPVFWISTFDGVGPNREVHAAFTAPDAAAVREFHAKALELGAEELHAPGFGRNTTPATSVPSCGIPTATTSRPSATPLALLTEAVPARPRALRTGAGHQQGRRYAGCSPHALPRRRHGARRGSHGVR